MGAPTWPPILPNSRLAPAEAGAFPRTTPIPPNSRLAPAEAGAFPRMTAYNLCFGWGSAFHRAGGTRSFSRKRVQRNGVTS